MSNQPVFFVPEVPNPYPDGFAEVDGFQYHCRLVLAREPKALKAGIAREASYVVAAPYTVSFRVDGDWRALTVPQGMLTDLTSVPQVARSAVGRVGRHLEAAIVHDYLFIAWQLLDEQGEHRGARKGDFQFANAVMFAGLKAAFVAWSQQQAIRAALTGFGISWGAYRRPVKIDQRFVRLPTEDLLCDGTGLAPR
jgi:hypothetical protein